MPRFLKDKKVVLILNGRHAGKKAVIVSHSDEGAEKRKYGHCIVAGLDRAPRKITKQMSKKKQAKRSKLKPFIKVVNANHVMPTRYSFDVAFDKTLVSKDSLKDAAAKARARREIKRKFSSAFKSGTNPWFFTKLRF
eukprot:m.253593 g.253593  ORF g.253593 m.253593 type:complete len:137 (+) comp17233_c0_seq1:89-499(+)